VAKAEVVKGDTWAGRVGPFLDDANQPYDLSSATIKLRIRRGDTIIVDVDESDAQLSVSGANDEFVDIDLAAGDTDHEPGTYEMHLQISDTGIVSSAFRPVVDQFVITRSNF
jgi:hypothetical protein